MSVHGDVKSFLRKYNQYIGKVLIEILLESFAFYCKGLFIISDTILKNSLNEMNDNNKPHKKNEM